MELMDMSSGGAGDGAEGAGGKVELRAPSDVCRIVRRLEESGYETWTVGGAVRDALCGGNPGDWDLATAARPGDVRRLFRRTVPIGIEHGTVGVLGKDGRLYEVTTFRRDVETFGRRARVEFADTLKEDLDRRDFTINAVAWHPLRGELRDPHGGVRDLQRGVLRTVGEASARFAEDRLRVLRALRFAGRFELQVEASTWSDLVASASELENLSPERIREELYKVLAGQASASRSLRLYERSGVLAELYPELQACVGFADHGAVDAWSLQIATVDALPRSRTILRLAALLHRVGRPAVAAAAAASGVGGEGADRESAAFPAGDAPAADGEGTGDAIPAFAAAGAAIVWRVMRRLRASNADANRVAHLVAQHAAIPASDAPAAEVRRWLRRVGLDFYPDILRLRAAIADASGSGERAELGRLARRLRAVVREQPPLAIADLAIGGADLRAAGVPAGPLYGEILRDLLERVVDDPSLNTRERLVEIVEAGLTGGG
jgi:tRNA nucleotidyltransferase (CCA-adding enzyme)